MFIAALTITVSCQNSPHSKWQVHNANDDQLTNKEKIDLFVAGSSNLSPASIAAIAKLYENQGDWNQAMVAIQQAIREEPMNSSYHSLKADYAFELGQKSVAYREALTAYQLGSKSLKQSLDLAKMAVALSEFSIVNNIIDSLLIAYPEDVDVLYMAARKHDKNNNATLASNYYKKVKQLQPENRENTFYYARFLINHGELSEAKLLLDETAGNAAAREVRLLQGEVLFGLEKYDSAAFYYNLALTESADTATFNRILMSYTLANNSNGLITTGQSAVQAYPENKKYLLITARTLDKQYQYEEALPYYLSLYNLYTLDTLVNEELDYLQRKIAYLQRKRQEERKLSDSLKNSLTEEILKLEVLR